jgi:signal transduction histidine kinase
VPKTATEALRASSGEDDFPLVIAATPISVRQRNIAFGVIVVLAVLDAIVVPFAHVQLARVDAFIPVVQSIMCVIDFLTAVLLLAQYSIQPARAILAVASGYLFSGLFAFIQTLAFPGAYSPTGLIGDGINSASWIFGFWHTAFPLALIVYALTKDRGKLADPSGGSIGVSIVGAIAFVLTATAALTWLAAVGVRYLPPMYLNTLQQTPLARHLNIFLWAINLTAFVLLFIRRRTVLDIWLTVVLFAWWPNFFVAIFDTFVRFSAGWYVGRLVALVASSTLLVVLLTESAALYGRLANAYLLLQRERADRLMSIEAATSAIVHEVRQPLTAIAMQSSAALRWLSRVPRGPEIERVSQCLNSTANAVNHAEQIVKSIRELFRQTPLRRTMLQLNDIVREALKLTEHDLQVEGVSVTTEYDDNLPLVSVDHTQIQQVIFNLVKNAIEAMRGVSPDKRHLRVLTSFDDKLVALYVQDTGPGIGVDDRDRIFEPFFTTKPTGTGLGLSICRTIVETHGGVLRLVKTGPHGSSFELAFPTSSPSELPLLAIADEVIE